VRAAFDNWSTGETAQQITASAQTHYTANFHTQYQLTTSVSPACGGTVSPAGGWFGANQAAFLNATPADQFQLASYSLDSATHPAPLGTVYFDKPRNVVARFACPSPGPAITRGAVYRCRGFSSAERGGLEHRRGAGQVYSLEAGLHGSVGAIPIDRRRECATHDAQGNSTNLLVSLEGITSVTYLATDTAGNREPANTLLVKVDHTPPVLTTVVSPPLNSFGWTNQNVTVEFDCSDALSGTSVQPQFVPVTAEGISSVKRSCTDNAGNSITAAALVGIEKTPASITATVSPATLAVAQTSVTVSLAGTFTSGPSGVDPASFGVTFVDPARRETVAPCAISSGG